MHVMCLDCVIVFSEAAFEGTSRVGLSHRPTVTATGLGLLRNYFQ